MISTNYEKFYIKGEKSGANTITLSSHYLINVEIEEKTSNLNGNVSYDVVGNGTKNVDITFTYSDLYINGETYNATVTASDGIDTLIIPVIINCSDTLIYTNIPSDSEIDIVEGIKIDYRSLPEVNNVNIITDIGTKINVSSKLNDGSIEVSKESIVNETGDFEYGYIQADNGLSQISNKIDGSNLHENEVVYEAKRDEEDIQLFYENGWKSNVVNKYIGGKRIYTDYYKAPTKGEYNLNFGLRKGDSLWGLFNECKNLKDVKHLDLRVTSGNIGNLFSDCVNLESINLLNTGSANKMEGMFENCYKLTSIPLFDTKNVTSTQRMFKNCYKLTSIPLFDLSNCRRTDSMFKGCESLTSIPSLNFRRSNSVHGMFNNCYNLTSIPLLDFYNVIYNDADSFYLCGSLTDLGGFKDISVDLFLNHSPLLTHESLMNVINNLAIVEDNKILALTAESLSKLNEDEIKIAVDKGWIVDWIDNSSKFRGIYHSNINRYEMKLWHTPIEVYNATINGGKQNSNYFTVPRQDGYPVEKNWYVAFDFGGDSLRYAFQFCEDLTSVLYMDTSNVTDMSWMFFYCHNLTSIPLLDTSNVTSMNGMFNRCHNLTSIPLLDTSNVTGMNGMFVDCTALTSIPLLDTSNVTGMVTMFCGCDRLTSIPLLDTSNVTDMSSTFYGCTSLTSIPPLDTSNVTDMDKMFKHCESLTSIPPLDTSNVNYMQYTFEGCTSLTSIPLLDTRKVNDMRWTFKGCTSLTDLGGFKGLKRDIYLSDCPLTRESALNVIEYAADVTGFHGTMRFSWDTLKLLTDDEIKIANQKGWAVTT